MKKVKKQINPSLRVLMQHSSEMITVSVKPVERVEQTLHLLSSTPQDMELWNCIVKTKYKAQFVYEFSDYPYEVLSHAAIKAYAYIKHHKLKFHDDEINLNAEELMLKFDIKKSAAYDIIKELKDHKIIFKTDYKECYYINVLIMFKGDVNKLINKLLKSEKGEQKTRKES